MFSLGNIITDTRYHTKIKATFKKYDPLVKTQLGDIILIDKGKFFASLLKSPNFQEYPSYNKKDKNLKANLLKKGWQLVSVKISELKLDNSKVISEIKLGNKVKYLDKLDPNYLSFSPTFKNLFNNKVDYSVGNIVIFNKKFYMNLHYIKKNKKKSSPKAVKKIVSINPDKDRVNWKEVTLLPVLKVLMQNQVSQKVKLGETLLPKNLLSLKANFPNKLAGVYDNKKKYKLGDIVKFNNKLYINLIFSFTFDITGKKIFLDSFSKEPPNIDKAWKEVVIDELKNIEKFDNLNTFDSLVKMTFDLFKLNW